MGTSSAAGAWAAGSWAAGSWATAFSRLAAYASRKCVALPAVVPSTTPASRSKCCGSPASASARWHTAPASVGVNTVRRMLAPAESIFHQGQKTDTARRGCPAQMTQPAHAARCAGYPEPQPGYPPPHTGRPCLARNNARAPGCIIFTLALTGADKICKPAH